MPNPRHRQQYNINSPNRKSRAPRTRRGAAPLKTSPIHRLYASFASVKAFYLEAPTLSAILGGEEADLPRKRAKKNRMIEELERQSWKDDVAFQHPGLQTTQFGIKPRLFSFYHNVVPFQSCKAVTATKMLVANVKSLRDPRVVIYFL